MKKQELDAEEVERIEKKIAICDRNIINNPNNSRVYYSKALKLIDLGKIEEALVYIDRAISIKPNNPGYRAYKAKLCYQIGKPEDALKEIEKINFAELTENVHDKHIKDIISAILTEQQTISGTISVDNKDNFNEFASLLKQKKLQNRIAVLKKENKELKITITNLQNSVDAIVEDNNYILNNEESVLSLGDNI